MLMLLGADRITYGEMGAGIMANISGKYRGGVWKSDHLLLMFVGRPNCKTYNANAFL
jgi:hypothetical protein